MKIIVADADWGEPRTFLVTREYMKRLVAMLETLEPLPEKQVEQSVEELLSKFDQGTRVEITVVFPGEYRVGFRNSLITYSPGVGSYYQFREALEKCVKKYQEAMEEAE